MYNRDTLQGNLENDQVWFARTQLFARKVIFPRAELVATTSRLHHCPPN